MWASVHGHTEVVRLLIEAGADVNARCDYGFTALMFVSGAKTETVMGAASFGSKYRNLEVVKLLVEAGADVNTRNNKGRTALKFGSKKRHTEIVKLLREAGAKKY